jgi:hypothetical protein
MDRTVSPTEDPSEGDSATQPGSDSHPCPPPATPRGPDLIAVTAFTQTLLHFFPHFNDWLDALPDTRVQDACTYEARFLIWTGLFLFLLQLGSRRQLDFTFDAYSDASRANLNRLAHTQQPSCPVHDTLDHLLEHIVWTAFRVLIHKMALRLIRMRALDAARLCGRFVLLVDGTGLFCFHHRHCDNCLERQLPSGPIYLHQVLEAKLLGPAGVVVSVGSEFIENADLAASSSTDPEQIKQDCELKAFGRLAVRLKEDFPQLRIVVAGDSLFACGAVLAIAQKNHWAYVLTFKQGRLPSVWDEFQRLLPLCPENVWQRQLNDGTRQVFRWVHNLSYTDSDHRRWTFHALECVETSPQGEVSYFAWITDLAVHAGTVEEIAEKGGRGRWKIENQGFNRQKNHGPNLEHVYSLDPEKWKAYYLLLQIAFLITQLVERGSLLRQLAADLKRTPLQLFGSLANIVRRLREALRLLYWPEECFDETLAAARRIRLDTS